MQDLYETGCFTAVSCRYLLCSEFFHHTAEHKPAQPKCKRQGTSRFTLMPAHTHQCFQNMDEIMLTGFFSTDSPLLSDLYK